MSKFDEMMLSIHKEAEKQVFVELETQLLAKKDFARLQRLQQLKIERGLQ